MKVSFEDENGIQILLSESGGVFLPNIEDLIYLKNQLYRVKSRFIDYDKGIIHIDLETE